MGHTAGSQDSGHAEMSNAWPVFRSLYSYRIQFLSCDLFAGLTADAIGRFVSRAFATDTGKGKHAASNY
jgi:hypothetical protein